MLVAPPKQVTNHVAEPMAFYANMNQNKANKAGRKDVKGGRNDVRGYKHCTNCDQDGHTAEQCFEKIGYPDWYKGKKNKKNGKFVANVMDFGQETPFDMKFENELQRDQSFPGVDQKLVAAVCQEVMKMFQGKHGGQDANGASTSMHHAGMSLHVRTFALSSQSNGIRINQWIIDTGASDDMCPHITLFSTTFILTQPITIHLPDGTSKLVTTAGHIQLTPSVMLFNVLYVPEFKFNLLSVGKLLNTHKYFAQFFPSYCVFQDLLTKEVVAVGKGSRCLYTCTSLDPTSIPTGQQVVNSINVFDFQNSSVFSNTVLPKSTSDLYTIHARLGHLSVSKMIHLHDCKGLNKTDFTCDSCLLAKFYRLPFPKHTPSSTEIFELIHVDLWGPYKAPALNGAHYFYTIVDDKSKATWTYLVHTKDQVLDILSGFVKYAEVHFNAKFKFFRSDNGTEVVNQKVLQFLTSKGIFHQKSMAYTPQQNGVVERKHRHLLETARALRIHASLPKKFWGDCILAATYLINKMPMKQLSWKSPFEVLHGTPPSYDTLKTIGCLCYAASLKPHKDKFDPRGIKCVFIGYPPGQKGYKLYNLLTHEVFHSRDVLFMENVFPFKENSSSSPSVPFPNFQGSMVSPESDEIFEDGLPKSMILPDLIPMPVNKDNMEAPPAVDIVPPFSKAPPVRRSNRNTSKPKWLKDFVGPKSSANSAIHQPTYPLFSNKDFVATPKDHLAFLANVFDHIEPTSYSQACRNTDWMNAMEKELNALEQNITWELTELPTGHKPITSK
ncbi:retrovirus-related pol polyprotein from transposon TNT 1-94 [Tanacetum coccineum]|uniref:Retrovirus-related pol polyprotein from transposon TNT 1-94 n=1 Tax=Tanacetum coccineum TaxID=301880 RepID=A0ABQ4Y997_9ASTR